MSEPKGADIAYEEKEEFGVRRLSCPLQSQPSCFHRARQVTGNPVRGRLQGLHGAAAGGDLQATTPAWSGETEDADGGDISQP